MGSAAGGKVAPGEPDSCLESQATRKVMQRTGLWIWEAQVDDGELRSSVLGDREPLTSFVQTAGSSEGFLPCSRPGHWPHCAPDCVTILTPSLLLLCAAHVSGWNHDPSCYLGPVT